MTTIGDIIFAIVWFGALIVGIRLMSNGWSLMSNNKREWKDYHEDLPEEMGEEIKKSTHPEMQDLQPGDELIVVKFTKDQQPIDRDKFKLDSPALFSISALLSIAASISSLLYNFSLLCPLTISYPPIT